MTVEDENGPLNVTVTANSGCPQVCSVTVVFGTQPPSSGNTCDIQTNTTSQKLLSPGEIATFSVEASSITRESNESYCHDVSHCGQHGEYIIIDHNLTPLNNFFSVDGGSGDGGLSPGAIVGIVLGCVVGIVVFIFWPVVGWKAIKKKAEIRVRVELL